MIPRSFLALGIAIAAVTFSAADAGAVIHHCADKTYATAQPHAIAAVREARGDLKKKKFAIALEKLQTAYCNFPAPALMRFISEAQLDLGQCEAAMQSATSWAQLAGPAEKTPIALWRATLKARCVPVTVNVQPDGTLLTIDGQSKAFTGNQWSGTLTAGPHKFLLNGADGTARTVQLWIGARQKPINLALKPGALKPGAKGR